MTRILLIARRELSGYLTSPLGYVVIAGLLFLNGWAFNALAMKGEQSSHAVLTMFFFYTCGFVAAAGVLFSMRLFAEEKQTGTYLLLQAAPVSEVQLVLGKFLGGLSFMTVFLALTFYMPLMVMVNGHVSWGHIFVGYFGLLLEGSAVIAIGTFASTISSNQLLSAVIAAIVVVALFVCWLIASRVDGALGDAIAYLDFYDRHFRSLSKGVLKLSTVTYFLSLTYIGLCAATLVLTARRWRA